LAVYKTGRQRGYAALNWKKSDHRGIFAGFQMPLSSTFGCTGCSFYYNWKSFEFPAAKKTFATLFYCLPMDIGSCSQ